MPDTTLTTTGEKWKARRAAIESALVDVFVAHAAENKKALRSPQKGEEVAGQLYELAFAAMDKTAEADLTAVTAQTLARRGLSVTAAAHLLQTLIDLPWLSPGELHRLSHLQGQFLRHLAIGQARQDAAQHRQMVADQIDYQQGLQEVQDRHAESLHQILDLNARLGVIQEETTLLEEATQGISLALGLEQVTIYRRHASDEQWTIYVTTDSKRRVGQPARPTQTHRLQTALQEDQGLVERYTSPDEEEGVIVTLPLRVGNQVLGGMMARSGTLSASTAHLYDITYFPILLQAFAQNLTTLWQNLTLQSKTAQRTHELELLQGQIRDSLWQSETAVLTASYQDHNLEIRRDAETKDAPSGPTIPITVGDAPLGQILLPAEAQLEDENASFVHSLVREMGNAINNARLLQTTRAYANQLTLATEVSRAATTILDPEHLMQEVVNLIRSRFDLYYVGLFIVDEERNRAILRAGTGSAGRRQIEQRHQHDIAGPSMVGTTIAQNQALVEQDVSQATAFTYNPLLPDTQAELALPLRTRGRTIGALTVQSTEKNAFSQETVNVLQSLADQLAIAIETANLFEQTQETLAETSRLYRSSRQITVAETPEDVYQALIEYAKASGIVDVAHVIVPDPEDPRYLISPTLWATVDFDHDPAQRFSRDLFAFSRELPYNRIVTIDDVRNDKRLDEKTRSLYRANQVRSSALIPIYVEKEWLGTLALHRLTLSPIPEQTLQPFRTLVDQAAIILANQRLLREIRAANEQLRQLDQLKTQFLANMSHELRTPLNSIIGFSRVILKGIDGPITPEQEEDLSSIHSNGQHLLRLINEILDMAKIEAGKMVLTFETVSLEEIAQSAIKTTQSLITPEKVLDLRWEIAPDLPPLEADPVRLLQILNNLLSNAVKYTEEGFIELKIVPEGDDHVHISVADSGIGISQEDFDTLFAAFEQVDSSPTRAVGGTGLGLPITKWLVNMHQGDIFVESEVGKGTTMHIILPIHQDEDTETDMTFEEVVQE